LTFLLLTPFFGLETDFDARVTANPEEEISVTIRDGAGRNVASGILAQDGTLITWNMEKPE
jgi:hypothetical protein